MITASHQYLKLENLTRLYKSALLAGVALTPLLVIWYLVTISASPPLRFDSHEFHQFAIAIATLVSGFISYVAWRSYQSSGEVFLRWLTAGFLAFTLIYLPHGLFTPLAHDNMWLFLLYGPASRLAMLGCLVYGLMQYGKPPENPAEVSKDGYWQRVLISCVVIDVAVAVLAYSPIAANAWVRMTMEVGALSLAAIGIIVMTLRQINSPLMILYAVALACFGQAAIAFMLATPWDHLWWLAHIIFAGGFFILSWGVTRALLTTRSFSLAFSEEQMMRTLEHEKTQTLTALHDLQSGIAERERLQRQLQQAQKMEAIGQLTGGIAHDFNNILASVLGYTELLREHLPKPTDDTAAHYLSQVQKAGERARDLVSKMLSFARGTALAPRVIDPRELLRDIIRMLAPMLPGSLRVNVDIDETVSCIRIDPIELHQIVANLVINARDAINGNGDIHVGLHRAAASQATCNACGDTLSGQFVTLSVTDTGCGMNDATLAHIFNPFFTTKEVGKGTGLGLSVIHGIMHDVDGHILVESTPDLGTIFRLLFPAIPAGARAVLTEATTPKRIEATA